jgi:hypothetical protein
VQIDENPRILYGLQSLSLLFNLLDKAFLDTWVNGGQRDGGGAGDGESACCAAYVGNTCPSPWKDIEGSRIRATYITSIKVQVSRMFSHVKDTVSSSILKHK